MNKTDEKKLIINMARRLLEEGTDGIVGLKEEGEEVVPYYFRSPDELDQLVLLPKHSVAKFVRTLQQENPDKKIGVVCRDCDVRTFNRYAKKERINPELLEIIEMTCDYDMATNCKCHHPEAPVLEIDEERCSGCKTCEIVCPYNALSVPKRDESFTAILEPRKCKGCGLCVSFCPEGALHTKGHATRALIAEGIEDLKKSEEELKASDKKEFEPNVIALFCYWCSHGGADWHGFSPKSYPANVKLVRVMCSTRVDTALIMEMMLQGADGVFVGGCHLGDCHYKVGNLHTRNKFMLAQKFLEKADVYPTRIRLDWFANSETERAARELGKFVEDLKKLGPSPIRGDNPNMRILEALYAARNASRDFRLRCLVGREVGIPTEGNVFNEKLSDEEFEEVVDKAIDEEFTRHRIIEAARKAKSVRQIAEAINVPPREVLKHVIALRDRGLISMEKVEGTTPIYATVEGV